MGDVLQIRDYARRREARHWDQTPAIVVPLPGVGCGTIDPDWDHDEAEERRLQAVREQFAVLCGQADL